jgi:glycosyltransferase involved in cell wall biosynthesis
MNPELAVFVNDFNAASEVFLRQLFNEIGKSHKVHIFSIKGKKKSKLSFTFKVVFLSSYLSLPFVIKAFKTIFKYRLINKHKIFYLTVLEYSRANKIYFPFLYMLSPFGNVLNEFCAKNKDVKIFTSVRGTEVTLDPITKKDAISNYKKIIPYLSKIHFLSEMLLTQYVNFGLDLKPHHIIYQGVNGALFKKKSNNVNSTNKPVKIINIGRFDYIKGLEFLLLALFELKRKNIPFSCTLVGYGSDIETQKLQFLISDLDLKENIEIIENASHEKLNQILSAHSIYVHTHLVTGISNSMLEAFSCGLPIISFYSAFETYPIPKLTQYFQEVERYNYLALAEKIANYDYSATLPDADVEMILSHFTLEKQANDFKRFFALN